ncbi:unnamed protein product [Rhizophagus irregularis]|nr:unnamed protein product [Rhizophagus irregularis]
MKLLSKLQFIGEELLVTAVDRKNLLDAIVFPATGFHDIPNQCIGADLDDKLGTIAISHLESKIILILVYLMDAQLHSEAVNFPKTGKLVILLSELCANTFPDFTEKLLIDLTEFSVFYIVLLKECLILVLIVLDDRLYVEEYKVYIGRMHERSKVHMMRI